MFIRLSGYNASIEWDGDALTPINCGKIRLPDDSIRTIQRISENKEVRVKNSPFAYGSRHYLLETPTGPARFECFDDLLQKGLGLTPC